MRATELSWRRRRRLAWSVALAAVAGGVATAIALLPRGHRLQPPTSEPTPAAVAPAAPARAPRAMHLSASDERELRSTIALFISTAVARHHPERSWPIVHPLLREGLTKRQWSTGNIPVVPYPAAGIDLIRLESAVGEKALVEVFLEPPRGSRLVRKTFQIELRRFPRGPHRWLVSSWVPEGVSQSQIDRDASTTPASVVAAAYHAQHIAAKWILIPLGLFLGALILLPAGVLVRHAYQSRRATREARASFFDEHGQLRR